MSTHQEIADRLRHFGANIEKWQAEAARLKQLAAASRADPVDKAQLTELEETAGSIYRDINGFNDAVADVAAKSPAAAAELAPVSDAIRLVLLEITELGVRLYSEHSGLPHSALAAEAPEASVEEASDEDLADEVVPTEAVVAETSVEDANLAKTGIDERAQ